MRWRDFTRSSLSCPLDPVRRLTTCDKACQHATPTRFTKVFSGLSTGCAIIVLLSLWLLNSVHAQDELALSQMQELLDNGFFAVAAREEGPRLLEQFPEHPQAHYLYSYALYRTGSAQQAREVLERAMELQGTPADVQHEWLLGLLLASTGDLAGAEELLGRVFRESRHYQVAMDWGRVAWQRGSYTTAFEAFVAAGNTEEGARELWPFLNQGRLLMQQGRYEEAIEAFDMAITVYERTDTATEELPSPAYVESYYRLGEAYERLGDLEKAVIFYEGARKADPLYMPATSALDRLRVRALP